MDLGLVVALGRCVGSDVEVVVFGMVASFLGRPWRLGSVLMRFSVSGLCGAGAGGAEMILLSMAIMPQLQQSNFHSNYTQGEYRN